MYPMNLFKDSKEPYLPTLLMSNASTKQSCLKTFSAQAVKNGLNSFLMDYYSYLSLSFVFHFHLEKKY